MDISINEAFNLMKWAMKHHFHYTPFKVPHKPFSKNDGGQTCYYTQREVWDMYTRARDEYQRRIKTPYIKKHYSA